MNFYTKKFDLNNKVTIGHSTIVLYLLIHFAIYVVSKEHWQLLSLSRSKSKFRSANVTSLVAFNRFYAEYYRKFGKYSLFVLENSIGETFTFSVFTNTLATIHIVNTRTIARTISVA